MKTPLRLLVIILFLAHASPLVAEEANASKATAAASEERFGHVALGVGYPDLRARLTLGNGFSTELKAAFDSSVQLYSARVGWVYSVTGPLKLVALGEAGLARISDAEGGGGALASVAAGFEIPLGKILRISADLGPMWFRASSAHAEVSSVDLVFNTALYLYLF